MWLPLQVFCRAFKQPTNSWHVGRRRGKQAGSATRLHDSLSAQPLLLAISRVHIYLKKKKQKKITFFAAQKGFTQLYNKTPNMTYASIHTTQTLHCICKCTCLAHMAHMLLTFVVFSYIYIYKCVYVCVCSSGIVCIQLFAMLSLCCLRCVSSVGYLS